MVSGHLRQSRVISGARLSGADSAAGRSAARRRQCIAPILFTFFLMRVRSSAAAGPATLRFVMAEDQADSDYNKADTWLFKLPAQRRAKKR